MDRSNRSHIISFLKNFAKLTGKYLYQSLFFNKVAGLKQTFSCEFGEISKNSFFTEHLWTTASKWIHWKDKDHE